jgi:hypothetical protein
VILCLSTGVLSFYSAIGVYMSIVKLQYSPLYLYLAPRLQIKGVFGVWHMLVSNTTPIHVVT